MGLSINPLDAPFGARVSGWDPGAPLAAAEREHLRAGLRDHLLLLFRGHRVPTDDELVAFARSFGELIPASKLFGVASRHPDILPVSTEPDVDGNETGVEGGGILPWHADYSYLHRPAKESFLEALAIPDEGGDTWFCDLYRAWAALDDATRERLEGARARHTTAAYMPAKSAAETAAERRESARERKNPYVSDPQPDGAVWHPVAFQHPEFGKTALYADSFVSEVEGVEPEAGRVLRDELIAGATHPGNVYRHVWEPGDMIVFDAVGGLHRRDSFDLRQTRTMRQLSTLLPAS